MPILIVIAIGIVVGGLILTLDKPSAVPEEMASANTNEKLAIPRLDNRQTTASFFVTFTHFDDWDHVSTRLRLLIML